MTTEEAPWNFEREPEAEKQKPDTRLEWKVDALSEKVERLTVPVKDAVQAAMKGLRMAMGRPDEQPVDYVREDGERITVSARSFERLLRQAGPGPGSVTGNSRILTVLVALNTALLVGIGGWLLVTVSQHDKDIAVIKCQIDPQCREALARVRS